MSGSAKTRGRKGGKRSATQLRLSPGFEEALRARLETPEGKAARDRLVDLILESLEKALPPELLTSLLADEDAFREMWPEIVKAYFRGLRSPQAR
jgi:hypothetical protein